MTPIIARGWVESVSPWKVFKVNSVTYVVARKKKCLCRLVFVLGICLLAGADFSRPPASRDVLDRTGACSTEFAAGADASTLETACVATGYVTSEGLPVPRLHAALVNLTIFKANQDRWCIPSAWLANKSTSINLRLLMSMSALVAAIEATHIDQEHIPDNAVNVVLKSDGFAVEDYTRRAHCNQFLRHVFGIHRQHVNLCRELFG